MADNLRDRVARALVWTSEQIESGGGKFQVRVMDMYLGDIQNHLGRTIPDAQPRYALRIEMVEQDPGGPEVVVDKKRSGLFFISTDGFVLARDMGWTRTLTEGFALEGCRAEAVECTVKGKQTAGFRITGRQSALIALNQSIGGGGANQKRIRDRIVATFNGEEQAGPGQRDTSGNVQTGVPRLVALPTTSSDDVRNPPLDTSGELILTEGESIIYTGSHKCEVLRSEPVAYGMQWHKTAAPESSATVWITNLRVAVSWKDWAGDPSAAELIERRRRAGFLDEERSSTLVAAQLMAAWIAHVFVAHADHAVVYQASDRDMPIRLKLFGLESDDAERLMRESAAAVATYRLATDDTLKPDESATLRPIAEGKATIKELDWGLSLGLPSYYKIGRDPASLPPSTAVA